MTHSHDTATTALSVESAAGVSIEALQAAHVARQEEWCPDQKPDLSFRGNEMAGEVGEACNVIKKLERERQGWRGSRATVDDLGDELADVIHTAILCSITAGIELGPRVVAKFNATSEKNGLATTLAAAPAPNPSPAAKGGEAGADALNSAAEENRRIVELETQLAALEARKDGAYEERNRVVAALAKVFPSGTCRTDIPDWSNDWHGCVRIDLPTGQVSWHFHDSHAHLFAGLPAYAGEWDGHDTPEKYRRLAALATHSPQPADAVRTVCVKALEWHEVNGLWFANTPFGSQVTPEIESGGLSNYRVRWTGDSRLYPRPSVNYTSLEEAKAVAEADYERRVLAALASDPAPAGEAVEPVSEAGDGATRDCIFHREAWQVAGHFYGTHEEAESISRQHFDIWAEPKSPRRWVPATTLEAERARADELGRERDDARKALEDMGDQFFGYAMLHRDMQLATQLDREGYMDAGSRAAARSASREGASDE